MIRHYLSLSSIPNSHILALINRALFFSLHKHQPDKFESLLRNKIIANVFYEPSTRTRISFEVAAKKLGAQVINFTPENSSVKKGETVYDTLKTLENLEIDTLVLRHSDDHIFDSFKNKIQTPIINAGAGKFEHPSQGLLDLITLKQEFGKLEGLTITVCGDIKYSRVAGSLLVAAKKFGMKILISGPEMLLSEEYDSSIVKIVPFDEAIKISDAVMMLRVQLERHVGLELNSMDYHREFGLTEERVLKMPEHSIFMHPGPFNRGIEISDEVVEHPKSRIFKQVNNGVFARMAILEWIMNKGE